MRRFAGFTVLGAALLASTALLPAPVCADESEDQAETDIVSTLYTRRSRELREELDKWRAAPEADKAAHAAKVAELANERRGYLAEVMRRDANRALDQILGDDADRADVEALAAGSAEAPVSLNGQLQAMCGMQFAEGDENPEFVMVWELDTGTEVVRLHAAGNSDRLVEVGSDVIVTGYRVDSAVVFDASTDDGLLDVNAADTGDDGTTDDGNGNGNGGGGGGGGNGKKSAGADDGATDPAAAAINPDAVGDQRCIVVGIYYADQEEPTVTLADLESRAITEVNEYYDDVSYGQVSFSGVVKAWYQINKPGSDFTSGNLNELRNDAIAAVDAEIDFNNFDRLMIVHPTIGVGPGWGTIGKRTLSTGDGSVRMSTSWIRTQSMPGIYGGYVFKHEYGHNFGAHHAGFWNCGSDPIDSSNCSRTEYGDRYSVMGYSHGNWAASQIEDIVGWFDATNVSEVIQDGQYTIAPIEISTTEVQTLKINRNNNSSLWVEYRQPLGQDTETTFFGNTNAYDGALFHFDQGLRSVLIDPVQTGNQTGSNLQAAVEPGQTFTDPVSGHSFTVVSNDANGVTVDVQLGACTDFDPPVTAITSPAQSTTVSDTITVTATATDAASPVAQVELWARTLFFQQPVLIGTDLDAPYSFTWDTTEFANGWTTLYTVAYDDPGEDCQPNLATSPSRSFYVRNNAENEPPVVTLITPTEHDQVNSSFVLQAEATDNVGVSHVEFWIDPNGYDPCGTPATQNGTHPHFCYIRRYFAPYQVFFPAYSRRAFFVGSVYGRGPVYSRYLRAIPPGNVFGWARAYDLSGNYADSDRVQFTVKGNKPFGIIILYGQGGQVTAPRGSTVTIAAEVTADEHEIAYVEYWVDDQLRFVDTEAPFEFDWDVPNQPGVQYEVEAKGFGIGGRTNSDLLRITSE